MTDTFRNIADGWWWFQECFLEWCYCMTDPDNTSGDFFATFVLSGTLT
jgi:hypothetical protein